METAIVEALGYPELDEEGNPIIDPVLSTSRQAVAVSLLTQLTALDTAIAAGVLQSMATTVGSIKVDYLQNNKLLREEGSRLLKQLASVAGLELRYDKYTTETPDSSTAKATYSVVNYW